TTTQTGVIKSIMSEGNYSIKPDGKTDTIAKKELSVAYLRSFEVIR
ncbi:3001_t:CDS:2, partial [Racocetra persica]